MGEKTKKPVGLTGVDTKMVSAAGFEPASPRSARIISPDLRHDSTPELRRQKKAQIILFSITWALRQKNGGGFKEKIKYPFSGLFQNIITKIHTIFLQVQHRDFPAPNRYFVYVIPLLKISASFDSFRHFYTRTGIFLLN